ncbi:GAF domain-containing protein [Paenibacillus hamazuiensis]|uniref:GAF domain-containing protein n=1 Tax=Paenibacillus hamazuiensis TaxID=2936508 RepID=UPI00200EFA2F|nr:GAF domain-containing protein [Paenibacillus hamazuiensis]
MGVLGLQIIQELERLSHLTSSDLAALSFNTAREPQIRWRYVYGNRSERYKQMVLKPGVGPAGITLRTGQSVIGDVHGKTGFDCPFMLSEQLKCAAARPIRRADQIIGVLLFGRRSLLPYQDSDLASLDEELGRLNAKLNDLTGMA